MQGVVHTLFRTLGKKGHQPVLPYSPSSRLFVALLATLSLGSLLSHSAAAQESAQSPTTATLVKQPISPEVLAFHARAKRPVPALPTAIDTADATAESTKVGIRFTHQDPTDCGLPLAFAEVG